MLKEYNEKNGVETLQHQKWSGANYIDQLVTGVVNSTTERPIQKLKKKFFIKSKYKNNIIIKNSVLLFYFF